MLKAEFNHTHCWHIHWVSLITGMYVNYFILHSHTIFLEVHIWFFGVCLQCPVSFLGPCSSAIILSNQSNMVTLHNFCFVGLAKLSWHPVMFCMTSVCLSYMLCFSKAVLFCFILVRVKFSSVLVSLSLYL